MKKFLSWYRLHDKLRIFRGSHARGTWPATAWRSLIFLSLALKYHLGVSRILKSEFKLFTTSYGCASRIQVDFPRFRPAVALGELSCWSPDHGPFGSSFAEAGVSG